MSGLLSELITAHRIIEKVGNKAKIQYWLITSDKLFEEFSQNLI